MHNDNSINLSHSNYDSFDVTKDIVTKFADALPKLAADLLAKQSTCVGAYHKSHIPLEPHMFWHAKRTTTFTHPPHTHSHTGTVVLATSTSMQHPQHAHH